MPHLPYSDPATSDLRHATTTGPSIMGLHWQTLIIVGGEKLSLCGREQRRTGWKREGALATGTIARVRWESREGSS